MTQRTNQPTRRSVLAATAMAPGGFSLASCTSTNCPRVQRRSPIYDFALPHDNVEAIVKIQGDLTGIPTINWRQGHILGVVEDRMAVPMLRYQSAQLGRFIRQDNGDYLFRYRGVFVYQDYETGEFLESYENPFTGKMVPVRHFRTSIGEYSYTDLGPKPSRNFNGQTGHKYGTPYRLPWVRAGDEIWVTLDERVEYSRPSDGAWRRDNAFIRYATAWSDLMNPDLTSTPASSSFHTHVDWFTWLDMPDHPGGLMQGGSGRKFFGISDLPEDFLNFAESKFPGVLTTPVE